MVETTFAFVRQKTHLVIENNNFFCMVCNYYHNRTSRFCGDNIICYRPRWILTMTFPPWELKYNITFLKRYHIKYNIIRWVKISIRRYKGVNENWRQTCDFKLYFILFFTIWICIKINNNLIITWLIQFVKTIQHLTLYYKYLSMLNYFLY